MRLVLSALGVALLFGGQRYDSYLVLLLGFVIGAFGMFSSKAAMLGIKPFSDKPKHRAESSKDDSMS